MGVFNFHFFTISYHGNWHCFRKSTVGKFILEKILPGNSKNWPYHTYFLVFCLKFKLLSICEYLNYYYNITNYCCAIPEKSKQVRLIIYFLLKKSLHLWGLSLYPWKLRTKQSFLYPWKFCKIALHPLEIPKSKTKAHENVT